MHDWQAADDEQTRNSQKGSDKPGYSGSGAEMVAAVNQSVKEQDWHPSIPKGMSPTAARVFAKQHGLPAPTAAVYSIDPKNLNPFG